MILIAAAIAGVLLVMLLLVLNMTVATGTLNGIIFYANIIAAYRATFLTPMNSRFITAFISWLNFDFGFDLCFVNGFNMYWKTLLQLAFPSYVIFLVVVIIVLCEKSKRFANLLGKKDPVATLATLVLLSYTKFLNIIIDSLSYTVLQYPAHDTPKLVTVWLPDATVKYLQGKHIALFIIAIITLLVSAVYTFVLFTWQWILYFSEVDVFRKIKFQKFALFLETYHVPYNPTHRYWTGLLLVIRIILYVTSAANVSGDPKVNLVSISVLTISLLLLKGVTRVYKKLLIEILEVVCYTNLALLSITNFMVLHKERSRAIASTISISITFLLFIVILTYHLYKEVLSKFNQRLCRKTTSLQLKECSIMSRRDVSVASDRTVTRSIVDSPKPQSSESYGLRELLLDSSEEK